MERKNQLKHSKIVNQETPKWPTDSSSMPLLASSTLLASKNSKIIKH